MIRMGRNAKTDQPEAQGYQSSSNPAPPTYQYGTESQHASTRVVTDSESIARDIKEGRLSGFVGHGTTLTGDTQFQMMLRVDGHLTGSVGSEGGTLIVGTNGQVDANINVAVATVNGTVNGDIIASERVQLGRTARVIGNISSPKLMIEEGALFEGGCTMISARENQDRRATEIQAQQREEDTSSYATSTYSDERTDSYMTADEAEEAGDEKAEAALI